MNKPKTIDEYIGAFPPEIKKNLMKVRSAIKETAPEAEEYFAYGVPAFKLNGKPLVYYAAFKSHIGFYPTPSAIIAFKKELSKYKTSEGTVRFPLNEPVPLELIKKMVKFRMQENDEKHGKEGSQT